jgi:hypothetical protein
LGNIRNKPHLIFSDDTTSKAIKSLSGELAWRKEDIFQAINELAENKCAILGGDVWAVVKENSKINSFTRIDSERIAIGIIKGKDGKDYVYSWHSDIKMNESWEEYVLRSKAEAVNIINKMNAEEEVASDFENSIYYNLVFTNKIEFENLR